MVGGCHSTVKQRQPHLASRCSMVFKGANKVILSFVESCMHCESRHDFRHCRCRRLQSRNSRRQKKTNSSDGTEPKAWAPGSRLQFPTLKCSQICQMLSISSKFIKTLISLGQNMAKKNYRERLGAMSSSCSPFIIVQLIFPSFHGKCSGFQAERRERQLGRHAVATLHAPNWERNGTSPGPNNSIISSSEMIRDANS